MSLTCAGRTANNKSITDFISLDENLVPVMDNKAVVCGIKPWIIFDVERSINLKKSCRSSRGTDPVHRILLDGCTTGVDRQDSPSFPELHDTVREK
jgi:hypothetical protein